MRSTIKRNDITLNFNGKYSPAYVYIPATVIEQRVIILCHGNYNDGKDAAIIKSIAECLALKGYIVISFDNLCYNNGWKNIDALSPEEIDLRWAAFAAISYASKKHPNSKITLIGHSMGATIALSVGAIDERVENIIAISPTHVTRFIYDSKKLIDFWNSNIVKRMQTPFDRNMTRIVRSVLIEENYAEFLKHKPTTLIYGKSERFWGYEEWIKRYAASIGPSCNLLSIHKAGHYFGTAPDKINQIVFDDLSRKISDNLVHQYNEDKCSECNI